MSFPGRFMMAMEFLRLDEAAPRILVSNVILASRQRSAG